MAVTTADLEAIHSLLSHQRQNAPLSDLIDDCVDHYRMTGQDRYAKNVRALWTNHLAPFWGTYKASDITTSRMREYQQKRLIDGAARATVNREMAILSKALRLGYDSEPRKVTAIPKLLFFPENNARKVFVSSEQLEAIRKEAKKGFWPWFGVMIELAYWLGWRQGELLGLQVRNIDFSEKCIRLDTTKNGDPREVPLTKKLLELVGKIALGKPADARLFPISQCELWRMWRELVKRAGCPDLHFHDLRRTSARTKRWAGVDTSVIMEIQGWKTEAMFRRYAIVAREDKLAALRKVERMK